MVQFTGVAAQLFVNDVIESAEYYRDVLGFSFDRFFGDPPVFVGVDRGAAKLLLKSAPEDRKPLVSNTTSPGGFTDVYIYCDDVMALASELRAKGAEIVVEPVDRPIYNGRELHVRDCNGWVLCFGQLMD
ncbi:VOC family protein [Phenylobacterium sp.]|uniref:VOC family protein n=1 Tax=Phenylobacterium sp. TaxID=1871053 RepID=UPI0030F40CBF